MKSLYELILIISHILFGFLFSYIYTLISYKKRYIFKDILFSIIYISIYIKLMGLYIKTINIYLLIFIAFGVYIFHTLKRHFINQIQDFYYLFDKLIKIIKKLSIPPFLKKIKQKIELKKEMRKKPWLFKNEYELF